MAFKVSGFITLSHIGSVDGAAGSNNALHAYITADDAAAVETAGYFNELSARLKANDLILVSLDKGGVPACRTYVVSSNAVGVVGITASEATAIV